MSSRQKFQLNDTIFHDLARWINEDPTLIHNLYTSPFATHAIFQALPPLARLYIPRLLHLPSDHSISLNAFRQTLRRRQRAHDRHHSAIRALRALHILTPSPTSPTAQSANPVIDVDNSSTSADAAAARDPDADVESETLSLYLHARFASNLRRAVTYGLPPVLDGPVDDSTVDVDTLDDYSANRLESILNYLVESSGGSVPAGNLVPALLGSAVLENKHDGLCITSAGFHFLLKHSFAQLWVLLRSILSFCFHPNVLDPLRLLFSLSSARPGACYSVHHLTDRQLELLSDLHQLGIVMMSKDAQTFRPTVVGVRLLSSANRVGADLSAADLPNVTKTTGEINIFVETNFRVYAYTTSPFQTKLLGLFTHLRFKLPGMVVGHLTRDAVRIALMNGITGDQIIAYLNAHAHPRMKKGVVPSNVSDEIRLWEAEKDRVQMVQGALLSNFGSQSAFERVLSFANDLGAVLWSNSQQFQLFVDAENYDAIKQFVRRENIQ